MVNRRYPFDEMDSMMNRMFRSMFDEFGAGFGRDHDGEGRMARRDIHLSIEEADGGYVVVADLPGFETEEIDLRFDDGYLTIEAEHEVSEGGDAMHYTRSRSAFERVRLPEGDVVVEDIEAEYHNGVLEIHVPMAAAMEDDDDEGHRIDID
jgi:HSP20 family protein